jgi:acyl carrier protein
MIDKKQAIEAIYAAVDELNAQLATDQHLEKIAEASLTGDSSPLDSLGLINLLVAVEQALAERHGTSIQLLDENLFGETDGPYQTLGTLADYAVESA